MKDEKNNKVSPFDREVDLTGGGGGGGRDAVMGGGCRKVC